MEWIKSAYSNISGMDPHKDKTMTSNGRDFKPKNWFSGENILGSVGKLITNAHCGLTQTKNCFTQAGRQCTSFLRLNSLGETSSVEEDLMGFPIVGPATKEMPAYLQQSVPAWGWPRPQQFVQYSQPPHRPLNQEYSPVGYRTRVVPPMRFMSPGYVPGHAPRMMPWAPADPWAWMPHIPQCVYNPPTQTLPHNVFQFRGSSQHQNRDTQYFGNHSAHYHQKPRSQGRSPIHRNHTHQQARSPKMPPASPSHRTTQQSTSLDTNLPAQVHAEVINKMSNLSVSDANLSCHELSDAIVTQKADDQSTKQGRVRCQESSVTSEHGTALPKPAMCESNRATLLLKKGHKSEKSSTSLPSTDRVDDRFLAIELCCSQPSSCAKDKDYVGKPKPQSKPEAHPGTVRGACIMLTPKIQTVNQTAGSRKKKTRPSSKKRRRQKLQRSAEGPIFQVSRKTKKQKTDEETSEPARDRCDSMSFVIDFPEAEPSDIEGRPGSLPVASTSPPVAKFSLFISAGDLSDDQTSEDDSMDSDSDFYDEDFGDLATTPFSFQIHCFSSPAVSQSPRGSQSPSQTDWDKTDGQTDIADTASEELDQLVSDANSRWLQMYGAVRSSSVEKLCKVQFPSAERLATVHTLDPEEVVAYAEARRGQWEEYARDRERFHNRITDVERAISYCLTPTHRATVAARLPQS